MQETSLYSEDGTELLIRQYERTFSYDPMEDLKERMLLNDLASMITESQMGIVQMRLEGCSIRQIAKQYSMTMKQVQAQLKTACAALKQLCYDI